MGEKSVCTSAVCLAELLQGLEERQSEKYWRRYRELVEHRYPVLALDEAVAATFGTIAGELRRRGKPRPVVDTPIAATARQHGLIVATLNGRDFQGIPGVGVEDWSRP